MPYENGTYGEGASRLDDAFEALQSQIHGGALAFMVLSNFKGLDIRLEF